MTPLKPAVRFGPEGLVGRRREEVAAPEGRAEAKVEEAFHDLESLYLPGVGQGCPELGSRSRPADRRAVWRAQRLPP